MTKDEALKLALEALEKKAGSWGVGQEALNKAAITAIKEALAQPDPLADAGKPIEHIDVLKLALDLAIMHHSDDGYAELRSKVRQLAKEALAQPEQEPVAWEQFYPDIGKPQLGQELVAIYRAGQAKGEGFHVEFLKEMGDDEVLLYTTTPKRPWVGLTDAEMQALWDRYAHMEMMRAIEAKLKEKNT